VDQITGKWLITIRPAFKDIHRFFIIFAPEESVKGKRQKEKGKRKKEKGKRQKAKGKSITFII